MENFQIFGSTKFEQIWKSPKAKKQGWEFAHRFFEWFILFLWAKMPFTHKIELTAPVPLLSWMPWVNSSQLLFCNERPERFPQGCSFIKSNVIELLMSLFKKERLSKERRELFPLGHKKGEKLSITFGANHSSFRAIRLNQECITHVALLSWATWENCSWSLFC